MTDSLYVLALTVLSDFLVLDKFLLINVGFIIIVIIFKIILDSYKWEIAISL